jgi:cyclic pyranopterin phosphate synthase
MTEPDAGLAEAYALDKLAAHPEVLSDLREGGAGRLITVHLMPQNLCNQRCSFCSFRLPDNKNSLDFDEGKEIPWERMERLLDDLEEMGVQGVEVTGGGEPLAYKHSMKLWERLGRGSWRTGIVTNGTLLDEGTAVLMKERLAWARVSIDAATGDTYTKMRKCPRHHFAYAWNAVRLLNKHRPDDPDFRLGVGFVICNENAEEVWDFVEMAKQEGADNVRISCTFSDQQLDYFENKNALRRAVAAAAQAKVDFEDEGFKVHNQVPDRMEEINHPVQEYHRCPIAQLLCVIEGEGKVYTCCTYAGSLKGNLGKFHEHPEGFKGLWRDSELERQGIVPSDDCKVACCYRKRNLAMIDLIEGPATEAQEHLHKGFI